MRGYIQFILRDDMLLVMFCMHGERSRCNALIIARDRKTVVLSIVLSLIDPSSSPYNVDKDYSQREYYASWSKRGWSRAAMPIKLHLLTRY
jgi:hypothetical protein